MKPLIVLGCDDNFVEHTKAVMASIAEHPSLNDIPIGLLDCGISDKNLAWFRAQGVDVRLAEWNIDFPQLDAWKSKLAGYKVLISRPFMPDYFPEYDVFLWLDSDLWVQTPDAIHHFLEAAEWSDFTAVLEFDRNYFDYRTGPRWWLFFNNIYKFFFGAKIAKQFLFHPNINAGVFCIRRNAPHWKHWQQTLTAGLKKIHPINKESMLVEQTSLNLAVYGNNLQMACLPATHNWSCLQARPAWNAQTRLLVEPHPPHMPLSIVHLTGPTQGHVFQLPVIKGNGQSIETSLDYKAFKQGIREQEQTEEAQS